MNAAAISVGWALTLLVVSAQLVTATERRRAQVSLRVVEPYGASRRAQSRARVWRLSWVGVGALPLVRNGIAVLVACTTRGAQRRRAALLRGELPATLDLIAVGVGAGASLLQSIELAATWAHPSMQAELAPIIHRTELGALLHDSLNYPSQSPPEIRAVFETLAVAVTLGTPLQPVLLRLAGDARAREARSAAAHARTVPVRLIFPLVLLVLPAFVLLTVVPALVAGWRGF